MNLLYLSLFCTLCFTGTVQQAQSMAQRPTANNAGSDGSHTPGVVGAYRIGTEDVLQISVWKEPSLSGPLTVRSDGMISLVLVGDVRAEGQTPAELSTEIQQLLKKYIQDPLVTVVVTSPLSQKVFLLGEVTHAGHIPLTPNLSVLQAISASGGLTPYANPNNIYILRTVDTKLSRINVDYRRALKGQGSLPPLMAGDTIVVR